jgi:hypothetical protein
MYEALAGKLSSTQSTSHDGAFESDDDSSLRAEVGNELPTRTFPCVLTYYGFNAGYSSKEEWKRHHYLKHIRLGVWRCDLCLGGSDPDDPTVHYTDFNRKDKFIAHLLRMHIMPRGGLHPSKQPPVNEANLVTHTTRCNKKFRKPPGNIVCLICGQRRRGGMTVWGEHMYHLVRYFERGNFSNPGASLCDPNVEEYLLREGLISRIDNGTWAIGNGIPQRNFEGGTGNETASIPVDDAIGMPCPVFEQCEV